MNELVFLEPNRLGAIPFTTSDVIADFTGNSYRSIQNMTAEEISEVAKAQNRISVLHEMGMGYEQIKALMTQKLMVGKLA